MDAVIESYFAKCDARTRPVVVGKEGTVVDVPHPEPYTVTGLGLTLGVSRQTILSYQDRCDEFGVEFLDTIKKAKERIHADLERRAYDGAGSTAGVIFGLKNNYGWKDTQTIEAAGKQVIRVEYANERNDGEAETAPPSSSEVHPVDGEASGGAGGS